MNPRKPRPPVREPYDTGKEFSERKADYRREYEEYDIACCEAVDAQRDREAMRDAGERRT